MRHRHTYYNAEPMDAHLGRDHWATDAEYVALHKARDAVFNAGKGSFFDCLVQDGSGNVARVEWEAKGGTLTSRIISYNSYPMNSITIHKQWIGVPEKDEGGLLEQRRFFHGRLPDQHFGE
jgi:hypothetical protein